MFLTIRNALSTSVLERAGDALLTPLCYSLGKRKYACFKTGDAWAPDTTCVPIGDITPSSVSSTALRCSVFILSSPLSILGALLKVCSLSDSHVRDIHWNSRCYHISESSISPEALKSTFGLVKACVPIEVVNRAALIHYDTDLDQAQKFEIAKLIATAGLWFDISRINLLTFTEEQRFEIAKLCAGTPQLFNFLQDRNFSRDQKFELLKLCPESYWDALTKSQGQGECRLKKLALTPKQYFEILKKHAAYYPEEVLEYLDLLEKDDKKELILLAATYSPSSLENQRYSSEQKKYIKMHEYFQSNFGDISNYTSDMIHNSDISKDLVNENIREELNKIKNELLRKKIHGFIIAAIFVWKNRLSAEEFAWLQREKLLLHFATFRTVEFIPFLIHQAARIAKGQPKEFHDCALRLEKKYPWVQLLRIPLLVLEMEGVEIGPFIQALSDFKELSTPKILTLFRVLIALADQKDLAVHEKTAIVKAIATGPLLEHVQEVIMILQTGEVQSLKDLSLGLPALATKTFQKNFSAKRPLPADFPARYAKEIESYRVPNALKIFAGTIQSEEDVRECLGDYVVSLLDGSYVQSRYDITKNAHLALFSKKTLAAWQENSKVPFQKICCEHTPVKQKETMFDWLHTKLVVDKHLNLEKFPYLKQYLESKGEQGYKPLIERLKKEKNDPLLFLQGKLIKLAQLKDNELRLLQELLSDKDLQGTEFLHDIENQIKKLNPPIEKNEHWIACETDDPQDLLLCGTETDSCQRINGDAAYNKGLVGYLTHGQTRLLAIKNEKGSIVARSLLRLLWDGKKPVLFLERLYSNSRDPSISYAIETLAKMAAKRLQCPLTTIANGQKERYDKPLQSLGGPAPYEYVDGAEGLCPNGKFTIPAEHLAILYNNN
jgi:hypothetical protein